MNWLNQTARVTAALAALGVGGCAPPPPITPTGSPAEVRAVWVVRYTLDHPDSVRRMVRRADEAGFNTLIVQVRGRGDAYYRSRWEPAPPPPPGVPAIPKYDPLALTIREAHRRGLQVHAWINTYLVANADTLPADLGHIVYRRPDLLAVPQPLARELFSLDPRDPRYVQALVAYAQANRDHVEGLYLSPAAPEVKEHIYSIWIDLLERYRLDGLHFDYVRYPAPDYDYSRGALLRFRDWLLPQLVDTLRERMVSLEASDPLVYSDSFPDAWNRFRRQQVTELVERIYYGVKKRAPDRLVTAAVFADADNAFNLRLQDWRDWLRRGILDVACPMAYTPDTQIFRQQIQAAVETAGGNRVWAGIGAYRNSVGGTVEKIEAARALGAGGVALFSYTSLVRGDSTTPGESYLRAVGEQAFHSPRAGGQR